MQRRFPIVKQREVFKKLSAMMNEEKKHVNFIFGTSIDKGNVIFEIIAKECFRKYLGKGNCGMPMFFLIE